MSVKHKKQTEHKQQQINKTNHKSHKIARGQLLV